MQTEAGHGGRRVFAGLGRYINNLKHGRYFLASGRVREVMFHLASLDTEYNADILRLQQQGNWPFLLSGAIPSNWIWPVQQSHSQHTPIELEFVSNSAGSEPGFIFDQIGVCCSGGPATPAFQMIPGERYTGVLQAADDVVYLRVPAGPSGTRLSLALWASTGTNDFDLYARCGAPPTPSSFDLVGFSGNSQEQILSAANACTGSEWHIAVHSYSGSGQFSVVASYQKVPNGVFVLKVGFEGTPTSTWKSQIRGVINQFLRFTYGVFEGQIFFDTCKFWVNTGVDCTNCGGSVCDVCLKSSPGTSTAPICQPGSIFITPANYFKPTLYAHEFGHKYLCLKDEYSPDGCDVTKSTCYLSCGHSVMANPYTDQHNLCVRNFDSGFINHPRDIKPGSPDITGQSSGWTIAMTSGRLVFQPVQTPDNFSYLGHDFNDLLACQQMN
jgi:hypothetical protein